MKLEKITFYTLYLLLGLLPLHAFLVTYLNIWLGNPFVAAPFWLKMWKEFLILLLTGLVLIKLVKNRLKITFSDLDKFILVYFLIGLFSSLLITKDIKIALFGARYDFAFLFFYLVVKQISLSQIQMEKIFKLVSLVALLVIGFGFLQKFILPENFLVKFGYSPEHSHFSPNKPLAFCQKISGTESCRVQSFLAGPNQLGSYLLVVLPLLLIPFWQSLKLLQLTWWERLKMKFQKKEKNLFQNTKNWPNIVFFLFGLVVLGLTYSRASWLGFMIMTLVMSLILVKTKKQFWSVLGGLSLLGLTVLIFLMLWKPDFFHAVVFRPSSTQGHMERMQDGIKFSLENPWGLGLGNAGPASNYFAKDYLGFIPESWYLQVSLELGLLGLIVYLSILFFTLKALYLKFKQGDGVALSLFLSLFGLMVASFFLHTWEDSSTALLYWGMVALSLNSKQS